MSIFDFITKSHQETPRPPLPLRHKITIEEAELQMTGAVLAKAIKYEDLFEVLEVATKTIVELKNRIEELERKV